jgi:hypothetical protein
MNVVITNEKGGHSIKATLKTGKFVSRFYVAAGEREAAKFFLDRFEDEMYETDSEILKKIL